MKRIVTGAIAAIGVIAMPLAAIAHNAGHIILPDGSCHQIGSFKNAPIVGQDRTQLDLVPETPNPPFDEIGVSFVGFNGVTPILPGPCRPPMAATSSMAPMTPTASEASARSTTTAGPFFSKGPKKER